MEENARQVLREIMECQDVEKYFGTKFASVEDFSFFRQTTKNPPHFMFTKGSAFSMYANTLKCSFSKLFPLDGFFYKLGKDKAAIDSLKTELKVMKILKSRKSLLESSCLLDSCEEFSSGDFWGIKATSF